MSTQQERVVKLLNSRKITAYRLSKETGITQSTLSRFLNSPEGKVEMHPETMERIAKYFEVSSTWLLTGEGEMLRGNEAEGVVVAGRKSEDEVSLVPLLPIAAQGGSLNDFVVSVKENDCERVVSPIRGADFAMPVAGDSMAPEYPAGSQIFIKKINERAFIDWGKVYVLDTCNGSVIKRVFPSDDTGKVKCVSINPEYPPFEVSYEDIYGMYRVLLCMSVK
jgi:hypothetical protein|nr:S24 family peptidase [uncultured Porphyromonas sp.]